MNSVSKTNEGIQIRIKVNPRSSSTEIAGEIDGVLKVKLNSPPVDGAANKELIKLFSKVLGVAKSSIQIKSGEKSRLKTIDVSGVELQTAVAALMPE